MEYRRFGRTNLDLSVITLGGMRYTGGFDKPRTETPASLIDHAAEVTQLAFDHGINHIETAHGYSRSERAYGIVLNDVLKKPRDDYVLMTKGWATSVEEVDALLDEQLTSLKTDRIDLYGLHGINTMERLEHALALMPAFRRYQEQGVIKHIGFSTHGPLDVICRTVLTNEFDFMNVHWYYFLQRNFAAIQLAESLDMGVFIISPNDKGGQLFNPSAKLSQLCQPLTPIQFNARFCLQHSTVHTLSFGLTEAAHFAEMEGIFPSSVPLDSETLAIKQALDQQVAVDPSCQYEGYDLLPDPSNINIPEVLRFRKMAKCYDMHDFATYRYNMLESKGHWFPGSFATDEAIARGQHQQSSSTS